MPRWTARPLPDRTLELVNRTTICPACSGPLWAAAKPQRSVVTLDGIVRLHLQLRNCRNPDCQRRGICLRPEREGRFALPHHEFGLDVIATVGRLRHAEHRSVPEIHAELARRGVVTCERTVTNLLDRYDELLALSCSNAGRLKRITAKAGRVILAIDGLQPDVGHEVLWVIRDVISGEVLLARSLLSSTRADLAKLLVEVKDALSVPIAGVVSDGQSSIRKAVALALKGVSHQLCHFHVLKELHKHVLDALRRLRRGLSRRGQRGRKRKPGRRPRVRARWRGLTNKEKSAFVFKHRWLIVRRRDKVSYQERADLATMLSHLPELKALRDFVDRLGPLFEEGQSEASAWRRHAELVSDRSFLEVPESARAIGALGSEKYAKMIAFLKSPACHRVRTNNHVERVNRKLRYEEKARYRWRSRRTTVRFLVLLLDRCWKQERAARNRWQEESPPTVRDRSSPKRGGEAGFVKGQFQSGSARSVLFSLVLVRRRSIR